MTDWITRSVGVMCKSTADDTIYKTCLAGHGDTTYLQWLFSAWGWTLLVALIGLVIALVFGLVIGVIRTLPNQPEIRSYSP